MMTSPAFKAQELLNSGDADAVMAIGTPDAKFVWGDEGQHSLPWEEYVQVCKDCWASFPDLNFAWSESNELNDGTLTSMVVVSGTHTGAPYGFGPFPPH